MALTPEERTRIYEEEKARLEAREQLATEAEHAQRKRNSAWGWWILGALVGVIAIGQGISAFNRALAPASAADSATATVAKTPEQAYLEKAAAYIGYMAQRGVDLGTAETQVQSGQLTLKELKRKFSDAELMSASARNLLSDPVPESCTKLHGMLLSNNDRFNAGCEESLEYWKDGSDDHISSGAAAIQASAELLTKANKERLRLVGGAGG